MRRALIECEFSNFDAALSIVEQGLNERPEDGALYAVKLMAEKKLVDERQLQIAALIDFEPLGENDTFLHALRFAEPELRQLLKLYRRLTDEVLDNWIVLDKYGVDFGVDSLPANSKTIMSKYVIDPGSLGYERPSELEPNDTKYSISGNYITWSNHPLRAWLNDGYIERLPSFISGRLIRRHIMTGGAWAPGLEDVPPDVADDKVSILSDFEAMALPRNIRVATYSSGGDAGSWWLRSPAVMRVAGYYGFGETNVYGMQTISDGMWCRAYGAIAGELFSDCYDIQSIRPVMTVSTDVDLSSPATADMLIEPELYSVGDICQGAREHIALGGALWRVLDVQGDAALLFAEQCVAKVTVGVEHWCNSLVRKWLNGVFLDSLELEDGVVEHGRFLFQIVEDDVRLY